MPALVPLPLLLLWLLRRRGRAKVLALLTAAPPLLLPTPAAPALATATRVVADAVEVDEGSDDVAVDVLVARGARGASWRAWARFGRCLVSPLSLRCVRLHSRVRILSRRLTGSCPLFILPRSAATCRSTVWHLVLGQCTAEGQGKVRLGHGGIFLPVRGSVPSMSSLG